METREFKALRTDVQRARRSLHVAYIALLLLPESMLRTRLQSALGALRDELAVMTGRSPQDVQEGYEDTAVRLLPEATDPQWTFHFND